jgi:hypothetical protein
MPAGNLHLRDLHGELEFIPPGCLVHPENNMFDRALNARVVLEKWDDWMIWETDGIEIPGNHQEGLPGTISIPETWSPDRVSASKDLSSCLYSTPDGFPFDDVPFEIDEISLQSSDLPLGLLGTPLFPLSAQPQQDLRRSFRGFSRFTEAEERDLQDIAMPSRILLATKLGSEPVSPTSSHSTHSPSPSPEPETRKTKKRKSTLGDGGIPSARSQSRKSGHNAIEKRYRTNLNNKINCLRLGIPSLSRRSSDAKSDEDGEASDTKDMDSKTWQQKYGKAVVLTRALAYIKHLETATKRLGGEVNVLVTRVGAFEKLAMSGGIVLNMNGLGAQSVMSPVKTETLGGIQEGTSIDYSQGTSCSLSTEFQQLKPKFKAVAAAPRRRGS